MTRERLIWNIVSEILDTHGDEVDGMSIHEYTDAYGNDNRKIYHNQGYCFELSKEEASDIEACIEEGFVYTFSEPWDGFQEAGIDKAIEILNEYAGYPVF